MIYPVSQWRSSSKYFPIYHQSVRHAQPWPVKVYIDTSAVFEADSRQFPRWSPTREKYYGTYEYHQRMDLPVRLEDSRWACCATCQKLHPHEEFISYLPKDISARRLCSGQSALVDICPCLTLSIRSRKQLVGYLMGSTVDGRGIDLIKKGVLEDHTDEGGRQGVLHRCSTYSTVAVTALFYLKHLKVRTRFEMSPAVASREMSPETVFVCPGLKLWQHWVRKYNLGYTYVVS